MSEYTPTVWKTGDVITAEKLNNIEEGIANAGGGSSDLNNPIELELIETESGALDTKLTASEIYELCQTGTPYFKVTEEQLEPYTQEYLPNAKYFINDYNTVEEGGNTFYSFQVVLLGVVNTTEDSIVTMLPLEIVAGVDHLTIASNL